MTFTDTEFYYTPPELISDKSVIITGEEANHITKVMRHSLLDMIFVTDGEGKIYEAIIKNITNQEVIAEYERVFEQENKMKNLTFCIPILKTKERLEFAIEKCVELGIANFNIFSADKGYRRGVKIDRWNKIAISAMKQSLRSHKPKIYFSDKLIFSSNSNNFIFDQLSELNFSNFISQNNKVLENKVNFIFGPEAGLTKNDTVNLENITSLRLTNNRLRSETAIITAASILSVNID